MIGTYREFAFEEDRRNLPYDVVELLGVLLELRVAVVVLVSLDVSACYLVVLLDVFEYPSSLLIDDLLGLLLSQADGELFTFAERVSVACYQGQHQRHLRCMKF